MNGKSEPKGSAVEDKKVAKMEASILKHFKYFLPYEANLIGKLEDILGLEDPEPKEKCINTLLNILSEEMFMRASNS